MPTESQWSERIRNRVSESEEATSQELSLIEEALLEHPKSCSLWCLRGDLIQLSDEDDNGYDVTDALSSYEHASKLDPSHPEPWESIGHYLDAIEDDPAAAESFFRKALSLGGGKSAKQGLRDVLDQLERPG